MLELYHSAISPCAQKVRLVLHEKGIEYASRLLNIVHKENLAPAYLALNPAGVVPTLVHDGVAVVESTLVCEYLEEVFPEPALLPRERHARFRARTLCKLVDERLHPALGAIAWGVSMRRQFLARGEEAARLAISRVPDPVRRGRQQRILDAGLETHDVAEAVAVYLECCERFDALLQGQPWLTGGHFGLADAAALPYVHALHQYALVEPFLQRRIALADWYARMTARPSFATAVEGWVSDERRAELARFGAECLPGIRRIANACARC